MIKATVVLICVVAHCCFAGKDLRSTFKDWKAKYSKNYAGLRSEIDRYRNFQKSAAEIDLINSSQDKWVADFTQFADRSDEEKKSYLGLQLNRTAEPAPPLQAGESVDLVDYPVEKLWEMTPVRSQGSCGSCWSFAAVGAMEGLHIKEHGEYKELSEQTLLDCTFEAGSRDGCTGGWSTSAVNWAGHNNPVSKSSRHGYLPLRADKKYEGKDGVCDDLKNPLPNALTRAKPYAHSGNDRTDNGLIRALLEDGPAVVYIFASWQLQFYQFGLYHGMGCSVNPTPNHAVVASGYGVDFFKIKNSWGFLWGRGGYAYFDRGQRNLCAVSAYRMHIDWRPNTNWDVCSDTHPADRTPCLDNNLLSESSCRSKGCCFDPKATGNKKCFRKGQITVYDAAGRRRVLYGSTPDFADLEFESKAASVEVQSGKWEIYEKDDYSTGGRYQIITSTNKRIYTEVQSVKILL